MRTLPFLLSIQCPKWRTWKPTRNETLNIIQHKKLAEGLAPVYFHENTAVSEGEALMAIGINERQSPWQPKMKITYVILAFQPSLVKLPGSGTDYSAAIAEFRPR